jgi:hypothetical protein
MAPIRLSGLIEEYLADFQLAWAPSTLKTERARLNALRAFLDLEPKEAYLKLSAKLRPYTLKVTFGRLANFEGWAIEKGYLQGPNKFRAFYKSHANLFKHAYRREVVGITFDEARELILKELTDSQVRAKALDLLKTGMRFTESLTEDKNNEIVGKGAKVRKVYRDGPAASWEASYQTFRRKLAEIGLKPHTLRKLCASKLGAEGAKEMDLLEIMGWESIQTASRYLQAKRESELRSILKKL